MLRNRIYYRIKPFMPEEARLGLRRWFTRRMRSRMRGGWPIIPGSERAPDGWAGWPHEKKFAVVLTHDVEGPSGLEKCRQLMHLEKESGFRSSFNFIPEGPYRVSAELRDELAQDGFEVGVHDLKHDGHLYRSHRDFERNAVGINRYLQEWGAVGFRSGFMLHNLDWLHALEVEYDSSTFDTDPFEPQPHGEATIFPFWVSPPRASDLLSQKPSLHRTHSNSSSLRLSGYIELPYSLPQDSTLFLLLQERTIDTWKEKLDWIAAHGGMALLDTHPDYMDFSDGDLSVRTYPVQLYREFLEYIRARYGGSMWHAVPREVARHVRDRLGRVCRECLETW